MKNIPLFIQEIPFPCMSILIKCGHIYVGHSFISSISRKTVSFLKFSPWSTKFLDKLFFNFFHDWVQFKPFWFVWLFFRWFTAYWVYFMRYSTRVRMAKGTRACECVSAEWTSVEFSVFHYIHVNSKFFSLYTLNFCLLFHHHALIRKLKFK